MAPDQVPPNNFPNTLANCAIRQYARGMTTSPETQRYEMARDIFLADNGNAPEEQMLKDWAITKADRPISVAYCYAIADGLIARGYFKADHIEYAADHPNAPVEFLDDDGYHWRDRAEFEDWYSDYTATLKQRHVGPLVPLQPAAESSGAVTA